MRRNLSPPPSSCGPRTRDAGHFPKSPERKEHAHRSGQGVQRAAWLCLADSLINPGCATVSNDWTLKVTPASFDTCPAHPSACACLHPAHPCACACSALAHPLRFISACTCLRLAHPFAQVCVCLCAPCPPQSPLTPLYVHLASCSLRCTCLLHAPCPPLCAGLCVLVCIFPTPLHGPVCPLTQPCAQVCAHRERRLCGAPHQQDPV